MLVRLFSFRPTWPGDVTDQYLRRQLLPALLVRPGLLSLYAARGSAETGDERMVVSIWALAADDGEAAELAGPIEAEHDEVISQPSVELLAPEFALDFDRVEPPQILRVFRGTVVAGRLADYVAQARTGTLADVAAEQGPHSLYLCARPPDAFVTVSVWAGWDWIQTATGGNIRQPIATQHAHLLESGTAAHYEIVPNTIAGRASDAASEPSPEPGDQRARPAELAVAEQP